MFGMMMNKSRRLLRRASTRDNILKKERERQGLEVTEGKEEGTKCGRTQPYFSVLSQSYAVDLTEAGELDCLSEEGNSNFVAGDGTSKTLTRSTSCTNVFFDSHVLGTETSSGQFGGVKLNYRNFRTTQTGMITDDQQNCRDSRISTKIGSVYSINAGTGSCADIPCQARQGEGCLGQGGLTTVSSPSASGHCIGLRLQMTLPDGHDVETGRKERSYSERSVLQDGPDGKREEKSQEMLDSDKLKDKSFGNLKHDNHDSHDNQRKQPSKTLLRSRSCSFILSLSYQVKDAVKVHRTGDNDITTPNSTGETASCPGKENHSSGTHVPAQEVIGNSKETIQVTESPSDTISRSKSHGPLHQYRRLRKSHSLLHFAGFTRDVQSGRDKNDPTPSGRKSTILENDCDDDNFDDICGQDNTDAVDNIKQQTGVDDDAKEKSDNHCPSVAVKPESNKKHNQNSLEDPQKMDNKPGTEERNGIATSDDPAEDDQVPGENNDNSFFLDANDELNYKEEGGDEVESYNPVDRGIPSEDHKCNRSDCRQCQFLSQFLVPQPPPKILPPSRQRVKSRDLRKHRKSRFFPSVSSSSSNACSLPTLLLPQGRGGRGTLQRGRTHDPSAANIPSGMTPHPPRLQPQQSKSHLFPHYKKPSSFQARISKLTKAMGIFAKRNYSVEEKPCDQSDPGARHRARTDASLKQGLECSNAKCNEKRFTKNHKSLEEVCKRFGMPVSRRVVAPRSSPVPGSENEDSNTLVAKSKKIINGNDYTTASEDEDNTPIVPNELRTIQKSEKIFSSPSSRKPHKSPNGDEPVRDLNQLSKVLKDVTRVGTSLKRDEKRNLPPQRTMSGAKNYSLTSRVGNKTDHRNRDSGESKTRTKKLDTAPTQISSKQDISSTGDGKEKQASSAPTTNFTGCYSVLPPIEPIPKGEGHQGIDSANQIASKD